MTDFLLFATIEGVASQLVTCPLHRSILLATVIQQKEKHRRGHHYKDIDQIPHIHGHRLPLHMLRWCRARRRGQTTSMRKLTCLVETTYVLQDFRKHRVVLCVDLHRRLQVRSFSKGGNTQDQGERQNRSTTVTTRTHETIRLSRTKSRTIEFQQTTNQHTPPCKPNKRTKCQRSVRADV
jgi:hypothetical protein